MDLKNFGSMARITKKIEVTKDLSITLHSLSALETQKALAELPGALNTDTSYRGFVMQMAFLIYATSHINDEAVTIEQVKEFYQALQTPLFNEIYAQFDLMAQPQAEMFEDLKKK